MNRRLVLSAVVAAALLGAPALFVSAADKPKTPTTRPSAPPKAVNKYCAVEGKDHEVDPKVTRTYKGKVVGFCCNDCAETFDKDPDKYMKRLE
jgi:YHS domain-containing protein